MAKYTVTQSPVSHLLALVESEQIAIPELQRPFVWDSIKVRDLMDSLYNGYTVGYLITWQSVGAALLQPDRRPVCNHGAMLSGLAESFCRILYLPR